MSNTKEEILRELHRLQKENRVLMTRIELLELSLLDLAKTAAKRIVIESNTERVAVVEEDDSDDTSEEFDEENPFKEDEDSLTDEEVETLANSIDVNASPAIVLQLIQKKHDDKKKD